jgi:hypothetical protein
MAAATSAVKKRILHGDMAMGLIGGAYHVICGGRDRVKGWLSDRQRNGTSSTSQEMLS